jgi:hypothetical protein
LWAASLDDMTLQSDEKTGVNPVCMLLLLPILSSLNDLLLHFALRTNRKMTAL